VGVRIAVALLLVVALLLGANLGWLAARTTPTACVQFAGASNELLTFTRSLANASRRAAQAAASLNFERLGRATEHLALLGSTFHDLGPRLLSTEKGCLNP
jgi:hypothetical protein